MAHRYGKKKGKKKAGHHKIPKRVRAARRRRELARAIATAVARRVIADGSTSAKRRAAGRKAWRTKVRKYGRARAVAMIGRKKRRGKRR